jgi:DNA-binding MarR family transcriptional regulator
VNLKDIIRHDIEEAARKFKFEQTLVNDHGVQMTYPQALAFLVIAENGGAYTKISHIADALGCSRGNMTGILDRLVRDGYITRSEDAEDRRVVNVAMTEKGLGLVSTVKAVFGIAA